LLTQVIAPALHRALYGREVPRYFFDIFDHAVSLDDEGIELADAEAARRAALSGARSMMCDQVARGRLSLHHRIEVRDEAGGQVLSLAFGDAVRVEPGPA
jgi:hypothetical protein